MPTFLSPLFFLAGCCLLGGAVWAWRRYRRRGWMAVQPRHRKLLGSLELTDVESILSLPSVAISGHLDRNVSIVFLDPGSRLKAYLKWEHHVSWKLRLANALDGFGFISRSLREARTLLALRREGIDCPEFLAVGEDDRGQAFLLVRAVEGAVPLRTFLQQHPDARDRRRLARRLGATLARIHGAGFLHADLYSKHVLVHPAGETIQLLDWQRACRRHPPSLRDVARDLAALHATLPTALATRRQRLMCWHAYAAGCARLRASRSARRALLYEIDRETRRLLARRHIREKRAAASHPDPAQDWVRLDGDALCVTSSLQRFWPTDLLRELSLDCQPRSPAALTRRWLVLPGLPRTLLVRRRGRYPITLLWSWLRGVPMRSPEQRLAALLLRLQRHAVAAPRVLAMGQRRTGVWGLDSFLLTQPVADTVRFDTWLLRQSGRSFTRAAALLRRSVLFKAGTLMRRLHRASCYLCPGRPLGALAVQVCAGGQPRVILGEVEQVWASRRPRPDLARRGLSWLRRDLAAAGCRRGDWRWFLSGYRPSLTVAAGPYRVNCPGLERGNMGMKASTAAGRGEAEQSTVAAAPLSSPAVNDGSLWHRLVRGIRRLQQRADWNVFAGPGWPDRILHVPVTDRFHAKQGRSTGRWRLERAERPDEPGRRLTVYLKRHHELPWWQGWLAALWPGGDWSPALQEWRHLEWARRQGLPVPEAVAAGEFVGPWGRLQSFLAVEELAGMLPLNEAIPLAATQLEPAAFRHWKRGLIAEMARLARLLHDRCYFHKDLYLCHFYIARGDTLEVPEWRGRVFLIDLHRLAHHPWTTRLWQVKDLAQLLYSSEVSGVTPRDRMAFWREYRDVAPRRAGEDWLRRWILLKWGRYRRHNARRKAAGL